ncbi:unnamed protein product [Paramecium pentaurelia]|uniref:Nuf2 DHR10-like domain-containing protein n=1 Tax=Paramecium pentaurelia TaxID=43138 RepID=A0A8S1XT83_9CILI|nr:unnamed protein product [Paramecium pentaurelia]
MLVSQYRQLPAPSRELPQNLNQAHFDQKMRFQQQQIQARVIEERPNFQEMQGGQPPIKPWLGEDVYMVAFLLSVENDRLREENGRIGEYVNQNELRFKGVDLIEGELIQLRNKIGDYEKKIAQLQYESEQWRVKYVNREKESEDQRYQKELQRRISIDREIRELTARFISDRNQLEKENRQLRTELDSLKLSKSSVEDIMRQADIVQKENQRLKQELDNLRKGFDELEYVLKTAADLEVENTHLKQQIENIQVQFQNQQQQNIQPIQRVVVNSTNLQNSHILEQENKRLRDENDRLKIIVNLGQTSRPQPFM